MNWGLGIWSPSGFDLAQSGPLPADAIDLTPGAENEVTVAVYKGIAMLSSNTYELDASFAVPGQPFGGDIKASASFISANESDPRTLPVSFTSVAIWDMSSGVYADIFAITETPAAPVQPTQAPIQPTAQTNTGTTGTTTNPILTQVFNNDRAAALASPAAFTSPSGALTQSGDSFNVTLAGVALTNFYATATYLNPVDMSTNWDIGMGFRDLADNTEFRFVVRSDGAWVVTQGTSGVLAEGTLTNFNAGAGGTNTIEVIAKGMSGIISFNGQVIQEVDLSVNMNAGDVYIASGMYVSSAVAGRQVPYQNFAVYQIAG